jgi:hypothetical protein
MIVLIFEPIHVWSVSTVVSTHTHTVLMLPDFEMILQKKHVVNPVRVGIITLI